MRLLEIARFEIAYQARRPWTWLYFAVLLALSLQIVLEAYTGGARDGGYAFNSPFVIMSITVLTGAMGLLVSASLAGDAGARDVQTRMHPLLYTTPTSRRAYLTGRFLAAFVLNALVLTSVPLALLLSVAMPGLEPDLLGPFQPAAYLGAYVVYALPTAFVVTALLFSLAALGRRAIASYLGAVLLFFASLLVWFIVAQKLQRWELARLLDPLGLTILSEISRGATAAEKNVLATFLTRSLFLNRALWIGIAIGVLALTHLRFRFAHTTPGGSWSRRAAARGASEEVDRPPRREPVAVPQVARTFGIGTQASQVRAIAAQSFRAIAFSWGGLVLVALSALLVVLGPTALAHLGVPLIPTTQQVTSFVGNDGEILWTIVPLLTVFYVGELVWRERDAGLQEIADATPAPEWVRVTGRVAGFALILIGYQSLLVVACLLIQTQLGYRDFELGLYLRIVLGLLLAEHLLFALLAFTVHVLVNQKYVGHLLALMAYAFTAFGAAIGVEHHLLVYGSDPGWQYSDLRGFGASVAPWAWFKLYWAAWALLLAVAAKLFWVRGREQGLAARLRSARQRLTRPTAGVAAAAASIVVVAGGFVLYNTNVLNAYETVVERTARRAAYERRYGRFDGVPQPQLTGMTLHVEIYPQRREVEIRGRYRLVNATGAAIDSIHLSPEARMETGPAQLDRPATLVLDDTALRHRIYVLGTPLLPGDSVRLDFTVRFRPRGFTNDAADQSVTRSATHFDGSAWLPALGYQRGRELAGTGERRVHGLPPRAGFRSLDDVAARTDLRGAERIAFEAVVGTDSGQIAVAPGALRRSWTERGRRYFAYATDVPIPNDFAIYSAAYGVHEATWHDTVHAGQPVAIRILHHPRHVENLGRMMAGIRASLDYFTAEFGPYPHGQLRFVEQPGDGSSLHSAPVNVAYEEGFALFDPDADPRRLDFPFAVTAHEIAHEWWGHQLHPARVEGAPLLSESLAWYSAMAVVERTHGRDQLDRLLAMMREAYLSPRARAGVPLLRSTDRFVAYRKGPFAMHALHEYVGAERVNVALRRLLQQYGGARPPLPTARDLYRELQAVTPDSLHYLLVDLFEANTYWELETRRVTAERVAPGRWRVTLDVHARKEDVDSAGAPRALPMNDLVEIGVYGDAKDGRRGAPLYLRLHRIRTGAQRITVTVPHEPASAGIDPRHLLIDVDTEDNVDEVAVSTSRPPTR
jgi:ABC-type transport system involved in multi-copper enzyme maturation permease subunit